MDTTQQTLTACDVTRLVTPVRKYLHQVVDDESACVGIVQEGERLRVTSYTTLHAAVLHCDVHRLYCRQQLHLPGWGGETLH